MDSDDNRIHVYESLVKYLIESIMYLYATDAIIQFNKKCIYLYVNVFSRRSNH